MRVKVLYGRAQTQKSKYIKEKIIKLAKQGQQSILIVPEQFTFSCEQDLVAASENGGILDAEVLSFMRLSHKLSGEVKGRGRINLSETGKQLLLYKTFQDKRDLFSVFKLVSSKPGFVKIVSDIISEFKRYGHPPEELKKVLHSFDSNSLLYKKTNELTQLYEHYESKLKLGKYDLEDQLDLLAENIPFSELITNSHVLIEEFTGFTLQEYKIIELLIKYSKSVTISLTMDEAPLCGDENQLLDLFAPVKLTMQRLMKTCDKLNVVIELMKFVDNEDYCAELGHLESNLYRVPYNKFLTETSAIELIKAPNIYSEITNLAQSIMKLIKEKNYRFGEINVATGNIDTYKGLLAAVFKTYQIPYFMDTRMPIISNPLIQLIQSLLRIISDGWKYRDVFSYLRTGLTSVPERDLDILEEYVVANGIQGLAWEDENPWEYRVTGYFSKSPSEIEANEIKKVNEIRLKVAIPIIKIKRALYGGCPATKALSELFAYFSEVGIQDKIISLQNEFITSGFQIKADEFVQTWKTVIDIFDQIAEVMGEDKITASKLGELFTISFSNSTIGHVPLNMDRVIIGDFNRSRTLKAKALFIIGAVEGVFPSPQKTEGMLSDADRDKLKDQGIEMASTVRQSIFEDQLITYLGLSSPTTFLSISFPLADGKGKGQRPSNIISQLKKIFPQLKLTVLKKEDEYLSGAEPAFQKVIKSIRSKINGDEVSPWFREAFRWYLNNPDYRWRTEIVSQSISYDGTVDSITPERAVGLYGVEILSSVSKMERYAQCPFSFFVEYGLKARERQVFDFKATDSGTLSHDVLEHFFKELKAQNIDSTTLKRDESDNLIDKLVNDILTSNHINNEYIKKDKFVYMIDRLREALKTTAWVCVNNLSVGKFTPEYFELNFDKSGDLEPLNIQLDNISVLLRGKIDRVDVYEDDNAIYIKVVDYKTGKKNFDFTEVFYGLQLQLVAYLNVLIKGLKTISEKPIKPAAILYQYVGNPMIKSSPDATDEEISEMIRKELIPNGLVCTEHNVAQAIDLEAEGKSLAIPVTFKNGVISGNVIDEKQFNDLMSYVEEGLYNIASKMSKGNCSVYPFSHKDKNACAWCSYKPICYFDLRFKGCKQRKLLEINDKSFFEKVNGGKINA